MPRMRRQSAATLARIQRSRDAQARDRRYASSSERFENNATTFESTIRNLNLLSCICCHRICWSHELANDTCKSCKRPVDNLFSSANDMDLGTIPAELSNLSLIEQLLIARVHPVVSVFKIRGQQTAYSGHTMNFVQHIERIGSRLPHNIADLNTIILFNRETPHGLVHFRVRAAVVRRALVWLRLNNRYYQDIIIDELNMAALPVDDDVSHLLPSSNSVQDEDPYIDACDNIISSSGVPNLPALDSASSIDRHLQRLVPSPVLSSHLDELDWPDISQERLNEFTTEGLICQAFPCLFPFGRGDLRAPRIHTIPVHKYFQYLMEYGDGRFATDLRFPYYAYNTLARWDAISCGNIYIRRNNMGGLSSQQIHDMAHDENINLANQIMYYGANLRGTRSYWKQRASELDQMVSQHGCPTVFFTLSAADYHWPDLFRLISPGIDGSNLRERDRAKLMHENPFITSKFFETRATIFIDKFLRKFFDIGDFWYRFEWQHRGSPHIHGLLWFKDAPDCESLDSIGEESIEQIRLYFDDLVSATINIRSDITPMNNPCRQRYSDLSVQQKALDLDRILSSVQTHSRCGQHCIRKRRATRAFECRYGFPIDLEEQSSLRKDDHIWKFFPKRNDRLLQRYNKYVTQVWRGNTDFSPITSKDAVVRYISKYASKGEHGSETYSEILKRYTSSHLNDSTSDTLIRQLMVSTVAERNYSAQEVMHLLMGWPLYHASRTFVVLNTNERWVRLGEDASDSLVSYYSRRPHLDEISLLQFAKRYRIDKKSIKLRTKECVVRVFPRLKLIGEPESEEEFYQQQCKLHMPWRGNFNDYLPINSSWRELFALTVGEPVPTCDMHDEFSDIDDEDFIDSVQDHALIVRDAGMAAARIHPGVSNVDPIGHRLIDEACIWPDTESASISEESISAFFRVSREAILSSRQRQPPLPFGSMSGEQQELIQICNCQLDVPNYAVKRVIVQGKAGTGKSAVIRFLCHMLDLRQNCDQSIYEVLAPTGAAALNVDGKTIHSYFNISPSDTYTPLNGESLRRFQLRLKHLRFLIIDEYSMVGLRLLTKIHKRMQEARPLSDEPFGGIHLYLFGDLRQLPPVMDTPIYMSPKDDFSTIAAGLVGSFHKRIQLSQCHRQSIEQVDFKRALDNLACGKSSQEDWELFMTRRSSIVTHELSLFKDAIHLYPTNQQVKEHNMRTLSCNGSPVVIVEAEHNNEVAKNCSDQQSQGLSSILYLSKGCRIMLRKNLNVSRGLVNGTLGTVHEIVYKIDGRAPQLPHVLLVQFDNYDGPYIQDKLWPLLPIQVSWYERGVECKRKQFPINLAYALTVHKSQGLTLDRAKIDIGTRENSAGQTYVAFSRVRRLKDLIIANSFNLPRLTAIGKMSHIIAREAFLQD